jgi:hypothetical protein
VGRAGGFSDERIADVFTFGDGKAIGFRTFFDEREGLEWAGVEGSDAN